MNWPQPPLPSTLTAIVALLAIFVVWFLVRDWALRWRRRRRWGHARAAESMAPALLAESGFDIVGAQVKGAYTLLVDGQAMNVALRADFVVSRAGRHYVAEVKSGQSAPRLSTASTRRQLLEYLTAFQVDGVLLVDAETRQIREVEFPSRGIPSQSTGSRFVYAIALFLVGVAIALFWPRR